MKNASLAACIKRWWPEDVSSPIMGYPGTGAPWGRCCCLRTALSYTAGVLLLKMQTVLTDRSELLKQRKSLSSGFLPSSAQKALNACLANTTLTRG